MEGLKLLDLQTLGFFKSTMQSMDINANTLQKLATNCPRLFEIYDSEYGKIYERSKEDNKFNRTVGIRVPPVPRPLPLQQLRLRMPPNPVPNEVLQDIL
jgi:hypothetical protein